MIMYNNVSFALVLHKIHTFPRRLVLPTPEDPITTNLTVGMSSVVVDVGGSWMDF